MLILWIHKSQKNEPTCPEKSDKDSFPKHNEEMKRFYLSHPKIETTSDGDIITVDGDVLATVQNIKLNEHEQN